MSTAKQKTRKMVTIALLGAMATVLMFFSFNVPLMPSFIKMDLSELPAIIASFAISPVSGVVVCLIKNMINLLFTTTAGVGELSNFLLGASFVLPAGLIYHKLKSRKGALIGSTLGAVIMAVLSVFSNYYVVYPIYTAFMPMETIMGMYQAISPNIKTLWQALIIFNMPFTFIKGMISVGATFIIYKKISPLIKGKKMHY